ncbi:Oleate hydratase [Bacillus thermotolerans]|uniref:Oleate hydratase n=21 Tax=Bacillales TaxID=1385 RepID=A0A0F5HIM8_BACTR|nr:Oleate hydratase [Bacillus thermotolerans]
MEAVYQLLEVDRGVPEVYASEFDARVLIDAYYQLNDRKSLPELVNNNFLKRSVLKNAMKKIQGTFIEELLRKHKLL